MEDSPVNSLHGSDSVEAAQKEIQKIFPMQSTVAVIKPETEPEQRGMEPIYSKTLFYIS